jgi:spore maturation protein CgeB
MRVAIFCHSLVSDWNHGNAHFLRGYAQELLERGCAVRVFEPEAGWSRSNLLKDAGPQAIDAFHRTYPRLRSEAYHVDDFDVYAELREVDLVIVHEWTDPRLAARIGAHRGRHPTYRLLFHDTHHRSVTSAREIADYDLRGYDGVLAFGDPIRDRYLERGWAKRAFTWHEAADTRVFSPRPAPPEEQRGDVVWIGNWGDEERTAEIDEFLLEPVKRLGLRAAVYGVRYPPDAIERLRQHGVEYRGWIPNANVPDVFAAFKTTVHIPRRPYLESLPGIPTIRVFEALACGIPLVSARWDAAAGLFTPGEDFLVARDGDEMAARLAGLLGDPALRRRIADRGRATIVTRHTCRHRVDELLAICDTIPLEVAVP